MSNKETNFNWKSESVIIFTKDLSLLLNKPDGWVWDLEQNPDEQTSKSIQLWDLKNKSREIDEKKHTFGVEKGGTLGEE